MAFMVLFTDWAKSKKIGSLIDFKITRAKIVTQLFLDELRHHHFNQPGSEFKGTPLDRSNQSLAGTSEELLIADGRYDYR